MDVLWYASLPRTFSGLASAMTLSARIDSCYDVVANVLPYWVLFYFMVGIHGWMIWCINSDVGNQNSISWWSQKLVLLGFIVMTWQHIFDCFNVFVYLWMMPTVAEWRRGGDTPGQAGIVSWFRCVSITFALLPEVLISLATLYYGCAKVNTTYYIMIFITLIATKDLIKKMCADQVKRTANLLPGLTLTAQDHQQQNVQARVSTAITSVVIKLKNWQVLIFIFAVIITVLYSSLPSGIPGGHGPYQDFGDSTQISADDQESNDISDDSFESWNPEWISV